MLHQTWNRKSARASITDMALPRAKHFCWSCCDHPIIEQRIDRKLQESLPSHDCCVYLAGEVQQVAKAHTDQDMVLGRQRGACVSARGTARGRWASSWSSGGCSASARTGSGRSGVCGPSNAVTGAAPAACTWTCSCWSASPFLATSASSPPRPCARHVTKSQ